MLYIISIYNFCHQGKSDNFLTDGQLLPENFVNACKENSSVSVTARMQEARIFVVISHFGFHSYITQVARLKHFAYEELYKNMGSSHRWIQSLVFLVGDIFS